MMRVAFFHTDHDSDAQTNNVAVCSKRTASGSKNEAKIKQASKVCFFLFVYLLLCVSACSTGYSLTQTTNEMK